MKKLTQWVLTALLFCYVNMLSSCSDSDNFVSPQPEPKNTAQVGTYVWGSTVYGMGTDGAVRLAEAYEKAGIKHVVLLVKGEGGTVSYFKNTLSGAPKARTDRDVLAETISAMHERGIKVYAWLMVGKDGEWLKNHPTQASYHFRLGYSDAVVDLTKLEYQTYMSKIVKEIEQNYAIDGFAFDMARFQGAYFGWDESDYKRLTAAKADGGYGVTLEQYNELVTLLCKEFGYPSSPNAEGRLVYDASADAPQKEPGALYSAYKPEVPGVYAFGKMREKIVDDICEFLDSQTDKPTHVASMAECTDAPVYGTIAYGMTYNQKYTFDVVCPMLYAADYDKDALWVANNINYLKNLGYQKILPSLQAYRSANTESLAAYVKAAIETGCAGYLLFRTGTYDMARPVRKNNSVELAYVRGTDSTCGNLAVTVSGATPTDVAMSGKLTGTQYKINGQTITFSGDALERIGDCGIITIQCQNDAQPTAVTVASDARIVYNAPME